MWDIPTYTPTILNPHVLQVFLKPPFITPGFVTGCWPMLPSAPARALPWQPAVRSPNPCWTCWEPSASATVKSWWGISDNLPSGNLSNSYWKWPIYSGFSHLTRWFSIYVMVIYGNMMTLVGGDWNMTCIFIFFLKNNPIDFHIVQRGGSTTIQRGILIGRLGWTSCSNLFT